MAYQLEHLENRKGFSARQGQDGAPVLRAPVMVVASQLLLCLIPLSPSLFSILAL